MRKVEAIICFDRLDVLRAAFLKAGVQDLTVMEVREYGKRNIHTEIYRSNAFSIDSQAMVKVETIVPQKKVSAIVSILTTIGQLKNDGENKILISSVNNVGQTFANGKGESV
jgi:nitrogen regulatory protein PII